MSGNGPLTKNLPGWAQTVLNPSQALAHKFLSPGATKYTDILTEGAGDPGGAFRAAAKAAAPNPGNPPALTDTPTPGNSAAALSEAEAEQRRAQGRASTILTSGSGVGSAPLTAKQTLLGS